MKVSESKYAQMVEDVRQICIESGDVLPYSADDYGINGFYKSENNEIVFVFYWDGLSQIKTPDGTITPLGSRTSGDREKAMKVMTERFGLEFMYYRDGSAHERWNYYKATK